MRCDMANSEVGVLRKSFDNVYKPRLTLIISPDLIARLIKELRLFRVPLKDNATSAVLKTSAFRVKNVPPINSYFPDIGTI